MIKYIIITPANNEEAFIEKTIDSVIKQKVLPLRWVVVNDGSTDQTGKIVERYSKHYRFIELINMERSEGRHFGNKVLAFGKGLEKVGHLEYEYIGNLDADISLEPDYYDKILCEFSKDPKLGIAGGMVYSRIGDKFVSQEVALDSVAGGVQLFRRACFEQIGGYLALPLGGIDAAAEITARMKGWKVRTFNENRVFEHRRTGTAITYPIISRVQEGRRLYSLGYGLLFFFLRCIYRSLERPRVIGSFAALFGYLGALFRQDPVVLEPEIVNYLRREQREKILRALLRSR